MKNNIEFACVIIETLYYKHEVYEISGGAIEAASKRPHLMLLQLKTGFMLSDKFIDCSDFSLTELPLKALIGLF